MSSAVVPILVPIFGSVFGVEPGREVPGTPRPSRPFPSACRPPSSGGLSSAGQAAGPPSGGRQPEPDSTRTGPVGHGNRNTAHARPCRPVGQTAHAQDVRPGAPLRSMPFVLPPGRPEAFLMPVHAMCPAIVGLPRASTGELAANSGWIGNTSSRLCLLSLAFTVTVGGSTSRSKLVRLRLASSSFRSPPLCQ